MKNHAVAAEYLLEDLGLEPHETDRIIAVAQIEALLAIADNLACIAKEDPS